MNVLLGNLVLILCFSSVQCTEKKEKLKWWQTEVFYQIYPRSFKDGDAYTGIVDLKGITQKLPYFKLLGVGCIWLFPILKSSRTDFGYGGVSDFRKINPVFGTMNDFDQLLRKAHTMGFKLIMDYVPNHTSDEHEWFKKSVQQVAPYTDYYVWKNAKYIEGKQHPPNNWISRFGKSAWEWNEKRGQYYLHQFSVKQPDLNYRNPAVLEEMKSNIIFWLSKDIDGLSINSVNFLIEDERFLDEPMLGNPFVFPDEYESLNHTYTVDHPEDFEIVKEWRKIFDAYSTKQNPKIMMTEAYSSVQNIIPFYGTDEEPGAHLPFNYLMITDVHRGSNASTLRNVILNWYNNAPPGSWANWVIGNHDNPRPATRFGHFLVDGLHMLQMLLPGTAVVYYGDEFGMEDALVTWNEFKDPNAIDTGILRKHLVSKDGCGTTTMPWHEFTNDGFTTYLKPWLSFNSEYFQADDIENEFLENSNSNITHLDIFRDLVELRRDIVFQRGDMDLYVLSEWVIALIRSYPNHPTFVVVVNLGSKISICNLTEHRSSLPENMFVAVPSMNCNHKHGDVISINRILLRPKASLVLTTSAEEVEYDDDGNIEESNYS